MGVISDDDELESLTHIKCKGKVERSNWTKNAPTEKGKYWYRENSDIIDPDIVEIDWNSCRDDRFLIVFEMGDECYKRLSDVSGEWSERLIPPE